jgi:hypothetical protein
VFWDCSSFVGISIIAACGQGKCDAGYKRIKFVSFNNFRMQLENCSGLGQEGSFYTGVSLSYYIIIIEKL